MKILELSQWLSPGGAERFIVDLSNELSKIDGNEVIVCTYVDDKIGENSFYRPFLKTQINYINLNGNKTILGKIASLWQVFKLIYSVNPDVVHCHLSAFNYILLPRLFLNKIRYFNTLHSVADKNIKRGLDKFLKSFFYRHGIIPITISPTCYQSFTDYMHFNSSVMIENGCRDIKETDKFDSVKAEIGSLKKTEKTCVFINVARIHPLKNHKLLLQAFNKLVYDGWDAILLIIGPNSDDALMKSLCEINTSGRAYFLGLKDNVSDYLLCSDAFCLSSMWEGAPISLLEAAFAGCYPIATPVGGCKDAILNKKWGLLSKDLAVESYYSAMKEFMEMKKPNRKIISKLYYEKYSMKSCANKYMKVFECSTAIKD